MMVSAPVSVQVYNKAMVTFQCDTCLASWCTRCKPVPQPLHEGRTCDE